MSNGDPLEHTLMLAAEAGRWDVVAQLGKELEARRLAGAGVARLDDERAKRTPRRLVRERGRS